MEFKGTKGKWMNTNGYIVWCKVGKTIRTISDCENRTLKSNQEQYNALLISKAPEMLEMLKILRNDYGNYIQNILQDNHRLNRIKEIDELIKQATEL